MKDNLILEGKNYISAKRAAKIINYAQDYIGQLCRSEKLDCRMVGRSWFVTEESLLAHRQSAVDSVIEDTREETGKDTREDTIKASYLKKEVLRDDIEVLEDLKRVLEVGITTILSYFSSLYLCNSAFFKRLILSTPISIHLSIHIFHYLHINPLIHSHISSPPIFIN